MASYIVYGLLQVVYVLCVCMLLVHSNAVFYAIIDCQFKQRNVVLPRAFHDFSQNCLQLSNANSQKIRGREETRIILLYYIVLYPVLME